MIAAFAARQSADDPLSGLEVGERPSPSVPEGWSRVRVRAASLNHHDVWTLRGVGLPADRLPMVLGCDGAGVDDDGNEVVVHAVVSTPDWRADETLDPRRSLLSEHHQGTFADEVVVPSRNLVAKPEQLSFEQAACLPTAWLTAYRMLLHLFRRSPRVNRAGAGRRRRRGDGAGRARVGRRVPDVGDQSRRGTRSSGRRARRRPGLRQWRPAADRVDAVMETVGEATWAHSMKSLRPGGTVVVSGATSGHAAVEDLRRTFFLQLRVVGTTMGTRDELARLIRFLVATGVRPKIDRTLPLEQAREGFAAMVDGELFGKVVFTR
jgi:NADPH:quinone reductase-like Zn-dependent oxidoreductase